MLNYLQIAIKNHKARTGEREMEKSFVTTGRIATLQ